MTGTNENPTRVSIDDIAASLIVGPAEERDADAQDEQAEDQNVEHDAPTGAADLEADADAGDEEEATDDEGGEYEEHSDDAPALTDDTKITVTVDGEQVTVTLAELKQRYSGEGAIEKRVQQATEARREALAMRAQAEAQLAQNRELVAQALSALAGTFVKPRVQKPDPKLGQSNPSQYLIRMEQYREDQARVQHETAQIQGMVQQYQQQTAQQLQQTIQQETVKLAEKLPELRDREKAPEVLGMIQSGAKFYGFEDHEIAMAADHRLFLMALDAAKYRALTEKKQVNPKAQNAQAKPLRPGTNRKPSQVAIATKRHQQAVQRARETGSVDDVAATLLQPVRK